ncbi:hypothetical protein KP509_1Z067200 [Ceratopteris richardii]|nr:hypothetical protein KP509_1Z067200 [Ceratopteris richardii]
MTIHTEAYHFCKLSVCRSASVPMDASVGETSDALVESSHDATQGSLTSGTGKSYLALAGRDPSMVELWDMDAGKLALQFGQDTSGQSSPQTKSSGMCMALEAFTGLTREGFLHILTGYEDGSVAIWDVRNVKVPQFMKRFHQEPVLSIAVDGPCLGGVSGAADNQLIFFSINYQQSLLQIRGERTLGNPGTADISLRNDDRIVATAGWDHRVRIYDYKRSRALAILKYHSDLVNAVCFSEDCEFLASASKDGMVALWSIYPPQKDDLRTI